MDNEGTEIPLDVAKQRSGEKWVLTPRDALNGGRYGVKWRVTAPDTHPKEGSFRFTVENQAGPTSSPQAPPVTSALDEALSPSDTTAAESIRWLGSAAALLGILLALGAIIFLAFVMVGRPAEVIRIQKIVRWSGMLVVFGTLVQVLGRSAVQQEGDWAAALAPEAVMDLLSMAGFGWFVLLRIVGGLLLFAGATTAVLPRDEENSGPLVDEPKEKMVRPNVRGIPWALAGVLLTGVSFLLDGHTATVQPWVLVWLSDLAHVVAAAAWAGGLAILAVVLGQRRAAGHPLDPAHLTVKFSVVAAAGLTIAGLAGFALTVQILDYPAQLWETVWGRTLIAKVLLVGIVAAFGAYNHLRLVPMLEASFELRRAPAKDSATASHHDVPQESTGVQLAEKTQTQLAVEKVGRRLRVTAWVELSLLVAVVGLTALLISSSPSA
ncbi:MAG: CopD family protein [Actinomycetia bacterium]|nr:CopD family protein [Actinomycetes bacterium]